MLHHNIKKSLKPFSGKVSNLNKLKIYYSVYPLFHQCEGAKLGRVPWGVTPPITSQYQPIVFLKESTDQILLMLFPLLYNNCIEVRAAVAIEGTLRNGSYIH